MSTLEPGDEPARRAPADERPHPLLGAVVEGRYRVLERIGGGGMGSVYRVEHLRLERHFALKLLRSELCDEPGMVQRFERESRLAASVKSEHVIAIVDSGELRAGTPYFVMELGDSDLRRLLLAEGPLAPVRSANLGIDTCRGLAAAHDKGLVHRDLKPENLLLASGDDGREIAKIADFGVAKALGANSTQPGALVGTVRYMAPEQVGLREPVGPATDIYALGVILYECLTGAVPFVEETTERTLYRIMTDTPESLRSRCPELPSGLAEAVDRALARAPAARYPSARAFAEALQPFAGFQRATAGGLLVTGAAARPESVTSPGFQGLPFESTVSAVNAKSSPGRASLPRAGLLALTSALAGAALVTLTAPEEAARLEHESPPRVEARSAPPEVSLAPPPFAPSEPSTASLPAAESAAGPAPLAPSAAVVRGLAAPSAAKSSRPAARSSPSAGAVEAAPRRQPPSPSFDPSNPYGP